MNTIQENSFKKIESIFFSYLTPLAFSIATHNSVVLVSKQSHQEHQSQQHEPIIQKRILSRYFMERISVNIRSLHLASYHIHKLIINISNQRISPLEKYEVSSRISWVQ